MFAISGLLMIISYIFAVMFTEMFKDLYAEGYTGDVDYFGDLGDSLFTLFQMMTFDNFANMTREMMLAHKWAWIPVVAYVVVAGFVIVNLIIAVICDAVHMLQDTDKAKLRGKTVENTNDDRDKINDHHHITHIDNPKSTMSENSYDYSNDDNVGDQGNIANKYINLAQQFDMLENHVIELAKIQNQTKISVDALSLTSSNPR